VRVCPNGSGWQGGFGCATGKTAQRWRLFRRVVASPLATQHGAITRAFGDAPYRALLRQPGHPSLGAEAEVVGSSGTPSTPTTACSPNTSLAECDAPGDESASVSTLDR